MGCFGLKFRKLRRTIASVRRKVRYARYVYVLQNRGSPRLPIRFLVSGVPLYQRTNAWEPGEAAARVTVGGRERHTA